MPTDVMTAAQEQRREVLTREEYERIQPLLYHTVDAETQQRMHALRVQGIQLMLAILRQGPRSREQSLALTHLEDAQMRAIQHLAMQGEPQLPPVFEVQP